MSRGHAVTSRKVGDRWKTSCDCGFFRYAGTSEGAAAYARYHYNAVRTAQKCTCGQCDIEEVSNFRGETIAVAGRGSCFDRRRGVMARSASEQMKPPTVGPKGGAGDSGAAPSPWVQRMADSMMADLPAMNAALLQQTQEALSRAETARDEALAALSAIREKGWRPPVSMHEIKTGQPEPRRELGTYIRRHALFGWSGELRMGRMVLKRWWRPLRRFAEYRASHVHLRYLERQEAVRVS